MSTGKWTPCPKCIGCGARTKHGIRRPCRDCHGRGWVLPGRTRRWTL